MTNPFAHDRQSNTQTDFSFADKQGMAGHAAASLGAAMGAPASSLGETDYRYPRARPTDTPSAPQKPGPTPMTLPLPTDQQAGYFPNGYAP